jgi:phage tail sheath gpL-like
MDSVQDLFPQNWLVPGAAHAFDGSNAIRGLTGMPRNILLFGQSTGTATTNEVNEARSLAAAITLWGEDSVLTQMWQAAFTQHGGALRVYGIAVDDHSGGVKALKRLSFSGIASEPGAVELYLNGKRVSVGVQAGDDADAIVNNAIVNINARTDIGVTATANDNHLELEYIHAGAFGSDFTVQLNWYDDQTLPAGITALAPVLVTHGANNPDLSPAIAAVAAEWHTEWVIPYNDDANLTALEAEMAARFKYDNMQYADICTGARGSVGTVANDLADRNSPHVHTICQEDGDQWLRPTWQVTAAAASAIEYQAVIDPAAPYVSALVGIEAPKTKFSKPERNSLLQDGGSTIKYADGRVYLERCVTNYTETPQGAPDARWLSLEKKKTAEYWGYYTISQVWLKIQQGWKLATDPAYEPRPGQRIITEDIANTFIIGWYGEFYNAGLTQSKANFINTLLYEANGVAGKIKQLCQPHWMSQLFQWEITSQFLAD